MQAQPTDEQVYREILPKLCAAMAIRTNDGVAITIVHAGLTRAMASFAVTQAQARRGDGVLGLCRTDELPGAV